eukprot:CAMPEP_0202699684 /NCGR_PEP_ID=MMETSP1385-20130828/12894_1 /ASSEMBLY_ACC=CAM_ASM_000861 /TAXON_ID=933848 /ORGANISM="Elphidium margaritaceum" /LENGTH=337 /DNA_ID=CAMNT_0049356677 /DNA_START=327 /DNA_END=1341 /DNA_ORIENTATION=+
MTFSKTNLLRDLTKSLSDNYAQKKEKSKSGSGSKKSSKKSSKERSKSGSSKLKSKKSKTDRDGTKQQQHKKTISYDGDNDGKRFEPPARTPPLGASASPPRSPPVTSQHQTETKFVSVLRPADDDDDNQKSGDSAPDTYDHTDHENEPEQTQTAYTHHTQTLGDDNPNTKKRDAEENDLVNTMNKMTLLVIAAVLSSFLSLIGNIFIEIHEMETIHQHEIDIASMWAFILPVFDMVITSLMLYLQFTCTHNVYVVLCGKLDMMLMNICMKLIRYVWRSEKQKDEEALKQQQLNQAPSKMLSVCDTNSGASDATANSIEIMTPRNTTPNNDVILEEAP